MSGLFLYPSVKNINICTYVMFAVTSEVNITSSSKQWLIHILMLDMGSIRVMSTVYKQGKWESGGKAPRTLRIAEQVSDKRHAPAALLPEKALSLTTK